MCACINHANRLTIFSIGLRELCSNFAHYVIPNFPKKSLIMFIIIFMLVIVIIILLYQ